MKGHQGQDQGNRGCDLCVNPGLTNSCGSFPTDGKWGGGGKWWVFELAMCIIILGLFLCCSATESQLVIQVHKAHQCFVDLKSQIRRVLSAGKYDIMNLFPVDQFELSFTELKSGS